MADRNRDDDRDNDRGDRGRSRERDDDRGSRDRGRDDDRRSARGRDDDRGERSSRDRDDRGSRDRDDNRGSRGGSRRSEYEYEARSAESVRQRADSGGGDFDKFLKPHIKIYKPHDGDNRIRIVPPGWKKADHYGVDIHVHYGVGADRQTYLCLHKMLGKPDPINEERELFAREADTDNEADKKHLRDLTATKRTLLYLIDRDNQKEGVQAWAMPKGLDMDIVKISMDKDSGEVLPIDHPEDGYDVTFEKNGKGVNTKYEAAAIARRSSPLGKAEWLEYAMENPLPDMLVYYDYDYIAKAFGGKGSHSSSRDRDDDRGRDREDKGRDRDDDRRRDRDDKPDDRRSSRGRDDERDSGRKDAELTWETIHEMTKRELEALVEDERLTKVDPKEAKDTEDLADWICDEMKVTKKSARRRPDDEDKDARGGGKGDEDLDRKMRDMRERRRD